MKITYMLFSLIGLLLTLFHPIIAATISNEVSSHSDMPYPVEVMQYEGLISSFEVALNGTIQEIMAQMTTLYPGFNRTAFSSVNHDISNTHTLNRRKKDGILCVPIRGQPWEECFFKGINEGIYNLQHRGRIGVNGHSCVQVSCIEAAAIWFCNDLNTKVNPKASDIANYPIDIANNCLEGDNWLGGQEFDTSGFSVIVRKDNC